MQSETGAALSRSDLGRLDPATTASTARPSTRWSLFAPDWMVDRVHEIAEGQRLALRAAELGHDDAFAAFALSAAGCALARVATAELAQRQCVR